MYEGHYGYSPMVADMVGIRVITTPVTDTDRIRIPTGDTRTTSGSDRLSRANTQEEDTKPPAKYRRLF